MLKGYYDHLHSNQLFKLNHVEYAATLSITCLSYFTRYRLQKVNELYD